MKTSQIAFPFVVLCFCTICSYAAAQRPVDTTYLAQDSKKLAVLPPTAELWIGTATHAPEGKKTRNTPATITFVYLVDASPKNAHRASAPFPEGTELKIHLTFKPDGQYETVYVLDLRRTYSASGF